MFQTLDPNPSVNSLGSKFYSQPIVTFGLEVSLVSDPSVKSLGSKSYS